MIWVWRALYLALTLPALSRSHAAVTPEEIAGDAFAQHVVDRYWGATILIYFGLLLTLPAAAGFYAHGFGVPQGVYSAAMIWAAARNLTREKPEIAKSGKKALLGYALFGVEYGSLIAGGFFGSVQ